MKWMPLRLAMCYSELKANYGPRTSWKNNLYHMSKDQSFIDLCQRIANAIDALEGNGFGTTKWTAVTQQFAFVEQKKCPKGPHGKMWQENHNAAQLAGFI